MSSWATVGLGRPVHLPSMEDSIRKVSDLHSAERKLIFFTYLLLIIDGGCCLSHPKCGSDRVVGPSVAGPPLYPLERLSFWPDFIIDTV